MGDNPLRKDMLALFEETRREIDTFLADLSAADKAATGTPEQPSAKERLASIAFWEGYMVERMGFFARGETAPRNVDFDALNRGAIEQSKNRSWGEVVADVYQGLDSLIGAVGQFNDEQLTATNIYSEEVSGVLWGEINANGYFFPMEEIGKFYAAKGEAAKAEAVKGRAAVQNERLNGYRSLGDLIRPDEVRCQQQTAAPLVIDVRDAKEYAAGHVAGAIHIPFAELTDRLADIPIEQPVITYCNMHHPGSSRGERAAAILKKRGYQVKAIEGGFPGWEAAGLSIETEQTES